MSQEDDMRLHVYGVAGDRVVCIPSSLPRALDCPGGYHLHVQRPQWRCLVWREPRQQLAIELLLVLLEGGLRANEKIDYAQARREHDGVRGEDAAHGVA